MKHRVFIYSLFFLYVSFITLITWRQGMSVSIERYSFILLLGSLLVKKTRQFILDWLPFLFILISYDFLRDIATHVAYQTHYFHTAFIDQRLFGFIPTAYLQGLFFHPTALSWYDYLATFIYFSHFVVFLVFAFLLWFKNRQQFKEYVTGITLLSYAGYITFILYPAAPPWLANQDGYLPGGEKVMQFTLASLTGSFNIFKVYFDLNPTQAGSMPSLHAGYAFLIFLYALRFLRKKAGIFGLYLIGIVISVIYLGEHYVIDVVVGMLYAAVAYIFSQEILHGFNWDSSFKKVKVVLRNFPSVLRTVR